MARPGTDVDLAGYMVSFQRGVQGWSWSATDPDGVDVPVSPPGATYASRVAVEAAALQGLERYARPESAVSGEELRARVRGRPA